jgi:DDE superfamily endonuclease
MPSRVATALAEDSDEEDERHPSLVSSFMSTAHAALEPDSSDDEVKEKKARGPRDKPRDRTRRTVASIFEEQGPYYVRRAYRMTEKSFWKLHDLLKPHMGSRRCDFRKRKKKHRNGGVNGLIATEVRLSAAIRYFAGGRPEDIAICHGIGHSEVFNSCWRVVDAVNKCPELAIDFPKCHEKQKEMALAFQEKSAVGIDCCAAAVDGMLLWIEKPTEGDCVLAECSAKKIFCGRKHKFGLNMQGTCDAEGRFIDVSIGHPASTSDFLAFTTSSLHKKIETPGFLAPGLVIFGDLAYVNSGFMMTPFKNVKSGAKDNFNFYHSQLRINIECAFGMFVGRWGILRRALPKSMGLRKVTALTFCLCRLHNFCLTHRENRKQLSRPLASDSLEIMAHGGLDVGEMIHGPEPLLHGGDHHDDTTATLRQQHRRLGGGGCKRDAIVRSIAKSGYLRPTPKAWLELEHVDLEDT